MVVLVFPPIPKGQLYILFYSTVGMGVGVGEAAVVSAYKELQGVYA
jgi:hypothetical protein